jgi:hypothetical protein
VFSVSPVPKEVTETTTDPKTDEAKTDGTDIKPEPEGDVSIKTEPLEQKESDVSPKLEPAGPKESDVFQFCAKCKSY